MPMKRPLSTSFQPFGNNPAEMTAIDRLQTSNLCRMVPAKEAGDESVDSGTDIVWDCLRKHPDRPRPAMG